MNETAEHQTPQPLRLIIADREPDLNSIKAKSDPYVDKSGAKSPVVVPTPDQKARIYMKRIAFSSRGQICYLIFIGVMMLLSVCLVMYSLVRESHTHGKNIYQPVMWVQILEGFVDFTFILEVFGRAVLSENFWRSPMAYIDVLIIISCVVTYILYNWYPNHTDVQDAETASAIYISRQIIRFARCVYFFIWFSNSFVEFKKDRERKNSISRESFQGMSTPCGPQSHSVSTSSPVDLGTLPALRFNTRDRSSPYEIVEQYMVHPSPAWKLGSAGESPKIKYPLPAWRLGSIDEISRVTDQTPTFTYAEI